MNRFSRRSFLKSSVAGSALSLPLWRKKQTCLAHGDQSVLIASSEANNKTPLNQNSTTSDELLLIPQPVTAKKSGEHFRLKSSTPIITTSESLHPLALWLQRTLAVATGFHVPIIQSHSTTIRYGGIHLRLVTPEDAALGDEGYNLRVKACGVHLQANGPAGVFYGIQALLQLMPPTIESQRQIYLETWTIKGADIHDYPRFKWRGLMLDESRHFFGKEFVKGYLDEMAKYKFNVFHWHITDDPGWRIEIKSLPRLTEVGAWRPARELWDKSRSWPLANPVEKPTYGGYYTEADIREVVRYARERFITIVPEIDVPGHSHALIAAYPNLSCTGSDVSENPTDRSRNDWPVDVVCPGNEEVFSILEKIVRQVAELFPGEFIHIGGDEVNARYWKNCPRCQARMRTENLKDERELQHYFTRRMSAIVRACGKRVIGWEEVLSSGLPSDAAVMVWRGNGQKMATEATKHGYQVVMSNPTPCVMDWPQGDPEIEAEFYDARQEGGYINPKTACLLSNCYRMEIVREGVDPTLVLGASGNIWTERISHPRHVQYVTWPRALALAEVLWSPRERKSWEHFLMRVEAQFCRFELRHTNYSRAVYDPLVEVVTNGLVILHSETAQIILYYSFDGSNPDQFYPRFFKPVPIPTGARELRVVAYRNGQRVGERLNITVADLMKRMAIARKIEERTRNQ